MQVIKCDICGEICNHPYGIVTWHNMTFANKEEIELCELHRDEFNRFWDAFYIKPREMEKRKNDHFDIDWSDDGSTMATDSWGGAGPDCNNVRGRASPLIDQHNDEMSCGQWLNGTAPRI